MKPSTKYTAAIVGSLFAGANGFLPPGTALEFKYVALVIGLQAVWILSQAAVDVAKILKGVPVADEKEPVVIPVEAPKA